ncbi:hypothetical protein G9A89_021413 [Geosiphon pyriformis]|nr:hypothetical protein G9A89_021413 [Geosiphon pyriformis]
MVSVKAEDTTTSKLLEIKNNLLSLPESKYVLTFDVFGNIEDDLEEFHEHYQCDNNEGIMPKRTHNTNAKFDLRYPEKNAIQLEPHSRTCIDLKIALEIPATTIVQLASKSSLVKRGINIRGGIIDVRYIGNIIAMLQNNSEKAYIIEPNKKIAQAIFLSLVKVA